jgi:hypothetical protein
VLDNAREILSNRVMFGEMEDLLGERECRLAGWQAGSCNPHKAAKPKSSSLSCRELKRRGEDHMDGVLTRTFLSPQRIFGHRVKEFVGQSPPESGGNQSTPELRGWQMRGQAALGLGVSSSTALSFALFLFLPTQSLLSSITSHEALMFIANKIKGFKLLLS